LGEYEYVLSATYSFQKNAYGVSIDRVNLSKKFWQLLFGKQDHAVSPSADLKPPIVKKDIPSDQPDVSALQDYQEWISSGGLLSLARYADFNLTPDVLVAVTTIFFPSFILYRDAVFLEFRFDKKPCDDWFAYFKGNIKQTEIMCSKVEVSSYLFYQTLNDDECYHNIAYIGAKLVSAWELELRRQFPDRKFKVVGEKDFQFDEYVIYFHQIIE
jgi:hypothetical protein